MKSRIVNMYFETIKKTGFSLLLLLISYSCVKDQQVYEVFKGDMIYSYLEKDTTYTECIKLMKRAGLRGMLSAYGSYTCLAPTNEAFRKYYATFSKSFTMDSLRQGQIDTIARTHIINNKFLTSNLTDGVLPNLNMDKRNIEIKFTIDSIKNSLKIMLNDSSQIVSKDNEVYNGVVQGISRVLKSSNYELPALINLNPDISIFSEALKLTGLADSLTKVKDLKYAPTKIFKDLYDVFIITNPSERKFGYTALIEDNQLLKTYGINTVSDLVKKAEELYPSGKGFEEDYKNRNNSLNQYISYHLIEKSIYLNKFFYTSHTVKNFTPDEFIETMLTYRIIRASRVDQKITLNHGSSDVVHVKETGGKTTVNGVYHLLDKMLVYSPNVENMLLNTRMRIDFASLFPELTNNDMRCSRGKYNYNTGDEWGFEPGYLKYVKMSKDTRLDYLGGIEGGGWCDFQGDDMTALGIYDITMRLLPVPPGTYELRFGYASNGLRSVTQIYFDNKPIGIPLDLKIGANDAKIGWMIDNSTSDNGFENDKMMRNRGYMKGPTTYGTETSGGNLARNHSGVLRRIIGTFTFTDYQPHTLRFKSVINDPTKQMQLDYFEWVPKSVFSPASGEPESRD